MSLAQEKRLRDLCRRAARETDVNKLLVLFLELDRTAEQEQQPMFSSRPLEHTGWLASEERPQAQ